MALQIKAGEGSMGWEAGVGTRQAMALRGVLQVENPFTAAMPVCPRFPTGEKKIAVDSATHLLLVSCYSGASGLQRGCERQSGQCLGIGGRGASQDLLHYCPAVRRSARALQRGIKEQDVLLLRQAI